MVVVGLTIVEVINLLENPTNTIDFPPKKPKGGEHFIFKQHDNSKLGKSSFSIDLIINSYDLVQSVWLSLGYEY